jgi:putative FmdB family regulatory protein
MPTYEYQCRACEHRFEQFQSMKDASLRKCPSCGKLALERLIGMGAAVLFKGSGFYQTDYRSESYTSAAKAESEKASKSSESASSAGGSESKPAAASDAKPAAPTKPTKSDTKSDTKSGGKGGGGKPKKTATS